MKPLRYQDRWKLILQVFRSFLNRPGPPETSENPNCSEIVFSKESEQYSRLSASECILCSFLCSHACTLSAFTQGGQHNVETRNRHFAGYKFGHVVRGAVESAPPFDCIWPFKGLYINLKKAL